MESKSLLEISSKYSFQGMERLTLQRIIPKNKLKTDY